MWLHKSLATFISSWYCMHADIISMCVGRCCSVVVCLVHTDLHQDHVTTQLHHVTSTSILVQRIDPGTTSSHSNVSGLCSVTHQRKSGKVLRKVSICVLDDHYHPEARRPCTLSLPDGAV